MCNHQAGFVESFLKLARQKFSSFIMRIEKLSNTLNAKRRRNKLISTNFTIISNNCWGGHVYRRYGLPYASPTVGMYFFPDEYIKFIRDIRTSLSAEFTVHEASESKYYKLLCDRNQGNVLIGKLSNGVEIVLLHYHNKDEAIKKWIRRCKRVNFEHMIFKFSSIDNCSLTHCEEFDKMPYPAKLMFSTFDNNSFSSNIRVNKILKNGKLIDDTTFYSSYIQLEKYLNTVMK